MKSMIVIPHCQSEHHINGMAGGWTNWPLSELGKRQAENVGNALNKHPNIKEFSAYTSDLLRSLQTAEISTKILELDLKVAEEFREINIGEATGKSVEWLRQNTIPPKDNETRLDYKDLTGGESRREVQARIYKKLDSLDAEGVENLLVFTHGYAATMFIAWFLRLPPEALEYAHFSTPSGSITELINEEGFGLRVLKRLGDTRHLV
ncbi:histidine phosphatase family protein [Paenibacillus eucommiae]|uniref:Phosphoglycerate mutase n=1 Tax=Paenibacillus eucommiae TaxID=1355755 RepID=A0ABS4J6G4_9BACL|nr:histidine phosphatase family protein [Paenibacillus eucommiae]MBP1994870.1 putative phosphoglycerate mutase [Paenibacillus eucommiae]